MIAMTFNWYYANSTDPVPPYSEISHYCWADASNKNVHAHILISLSFTNMPLTFYKNC